MLTYTGKEGDTADPYFFFPLSTYYKKVNSTIITPEQASYIVIKPNHDHCRNCLLRG